MIRNREEAAQAAELSTRNAKGYCQLWTREIFGAPSVGDVDGDRDSDAIDGWLFEKRKHPGDRNPPRGVPVAFGNKFGHRAVSLGNGRIRSTDMSNMGAYMPGHVGTVTIAQIERAMKVSYLGWSEDISGIVIPLPPAKPKPKTRGRHIDRALVHLEAAQGKGVRRKKINQAIAEIRSIAYLKEK